MKFDGIFVIVINLSISLLCLQAGGFFVLEWSDQSQHLSSPIEMEWNMEQIYFLQ